jgi:hypothetical protein
MDNLAAQPIAIWTVARRQPFGVCFQLGCFRVGAGAKTDCRQT